MTITTTLFPDGEEFPYREEKLGGLSLSFFLDEHSECHHCGGRTARVMVAPENWRPRRFFLCHKCYKSEVAEPGSIINRYKPTDVGEDAAYTTDMRSVWDAEVGRMRRGNHGYGDANAERYGLSDFRERTYVEPPKSYVRGKGDDPVFPCFYCKKETARKGIRGDGAEVPMCRECGKEHNTQQKPVSKFEPTRYSHLWWRINNEARAKDKGRCHFCGRRSKWADYIVLPKDGGVWEAGNVASVCYTCNRDRGQIK